MTKNVEVTVDIKIARIMLQVAGFVGTSEMTDEEIFNKALTMNEEYGVKSCISDQPDMREKVKEYISELDVEIDRCHKLVEEHMNDEAEVLADRVIVRLKTLIEVKNDLQSRLEELV